MEFERIGSFTLGWGESLVWDEQRDRIYFVDCLASTVHWLDHESEELHTVATASMPTGLVPTDDERLLVVLDDGLYVLDPDSDECDFLTRYPAALGGRANDACADLEGNLITGTLNLGPADGSAWWYSTRDGWRLLDPDISNTNGPQAAILDGVDSLIIGDTAAHYYAYPYKASTGTVGERRVFGDVTTLNGHPDGSTLDSDGGLWCALFDGSQIARFTTTGLDRTVELPMRNPTDVTFGGPDLDELYIASIDGPGELAGALVRIKGTGNTGRLEPRFHMPRNTAR